MKDERFWISFADPNAPRGSQFLGVVVVEIDAADRVQGAAGAEAKFPRRWRSGSQIDAIAALHKSHRLGINPGGEAQVMSLGPDFVIPPEQYNRLLSKAEAEALNALQQN